MKVLLDVHPAYVPSLTAARAAYNAKLPATVSVDDQGQPLAPGVTRPNPALLATDEAYVQMRHAEMLKDELARFGVLPPPLVVDGVPQEVSAAQAVQELIVSGYHSDDPAQSKVVACINRIADPITRAMLRALWERSQVFQRQRAELVMLATTAAPDGLGMTPADLDQIFVRAAMR